MNRAPDLASLLEPIRRQLDAVDALLISTAGQASEPIRSALANLLSGGKRMRPAIVLLVARLYDRDPAPFVQLAAALEMLHTATLIHDDVIDRAALRRGHRTLHMQWATKAAVLAGDYLLAEAVSMTAALDVPRLVQILAQALRAMCAGEIRQSLRRRLPSDMRQAYHETIQAKSASLFAAGAEMASLLAQADPAQVAALRDFGWELGIAFQMTDDILDMTGAVGELGKDAAADLRQGLITLPTLVYLETAQDPRAVQSVLDGQRDPEQVAAAIEAIITSGALQAASEEVCAHVARGRLALQSLPHNAWKQLLDDLLAFVVQRRS
jgi:geranylgeranyl pyrophosphate synthase